MKLKEIIDFFDDKESIIIDYRNKKYYYSKITEELLNKKIINICVYHGCIVVIEAED